MYKKLLSRNKVFYLFFTLFYSTYFFSIDLINPEVNLEDSEEESYQKLRNRTCQIEGLAGNHKVELCELIRAFSKTFSSMTHHRNAILLFGPPGTGKTTIAAKIAQASGAKFIAKSAASMVTSMQGSGAQAIRNVFDDEVEKALNKGDKVVLFIDEIDGFSREREKNSHEEYANALLEIMQKIIAYKDRKQLLIIVATNKKELLDQGIISRSKEIEVGLPDREMCAAIFEHYLNKYPHNLSDKIFELSTHAHNAQLSGRDIENVVNEAYLKSESIGATKVLHGAIVDVLNEMIKRKNEEQKKIREEEKEKEIEKKMCNMRFEEMKYAENERFRRRFICKDEDEDDLKKIRDGAITAAAVAKVANELKNFFKGSENDSSKNDNNDSNDDE